MARSSIVTLLKLSLCLLAVLATPFPTQEYLNQQQASLAGFGGHDDPLKNFVSDVVHEDAVIGGSSSGSSGTTSTTTTTSLAAAAPLSSSSSLRYTTQPEEQGISRPSWFTSTLLARRLLAKSSIGIASTVYQQPSSSSSSSGPADLQGVPISLPEYIADCSASDSGTQEDDYDGNINNGNPIFLGLYVSTTFRNAAQGSNVSLSIDWWTHLNSTEPVYPDFPLSEAGLPRVSLLGYVERIEDGSSKSLEECFLAAHPDARVWLPGKEDSPHRGFWARLVVTQAYWVGGFGDLQQIGWVNMTEWRGIGRYASADGIGDGSGRGWEDVRLPGE
ncbi:hypothetical protein UA08_02865 [Talaromyces atroroseus]|uniref:CREG-like beta-barrel domain-containing protein n=1 Tax=Talaromyces atroroseus TaxID=1441469 RepID=A0A225AN02_TALAT|nr:hypothetical protein UA08_02865 [Talaromyces atroroseus]OKL62270.1 hypothetical protein UA08_02865 [Talaromyces atroroseus]